ncbi:MAG: hypothetical protein KF894_22550 [Labilithrix sp.]|nr:hypothetical protein [Labilithrix sp.]
MSRRLPFALFTLLLAGAPLAGAACDSRPVAPIDDEGDARGAPPGDRDAALTETDAADDAPVPTDASDDADDHTDARDGTDARDDAG